MNNRDVVQSYLGAYGIKQVKGPAMVEGEIAPLTPYLIADIAQSYYRHNIAPCKWTQDKARLKRKIVDGYKEFFDTLTKPLTLDQQIYIGDKNDEFIAYIDKDLFITEIAYQNCFIGCTDVDQQKILGGLLMCGNLAKLATGCYEELYAGHLIADMYTRGLKQMRFACKEIGKRLMKEWRVPDEVVPDKYAEQLDKAADVLMLKMCKWIDNERGGKMEKVA